jgi:hypothetical protein
MGMFKRWVVNAHIGTYLYIHMLPYVPKYIYVGYFQEIGGRYVYHT